MRLFGTYYHGKHKWENYLLDIQETIESVNTTHQQNIRLQEALRGVAHEHLDELRQQTEQLHDINKALNSGFEELRGTFEWGFTLMVDP